MHSPSLTKDEYRGLLQQVLATSPTTRRIEFAIVFLAVITFGLAAYVSLDSWLGIIFLAPVAGGSILLLSIVQHECAHRTLLNNKSANDVLGLLCGILTLQPHHSFRRGHKAHHLYVGSQSGKDPTPSRQLPRSWWLALLLRIRIVPFVFFGGVFLPYFFYDYSPTAGVRRWSQIAGTTLTIIGTFLVHAAVTMLFSSWHYPVFLFAAIVWFGIFYEHLFTQHQHVGLRPTRSRHLHKYREQANFSRSVEVPFARAILYFNLHKEHHLYPNVNYRRLPQLHDLIEKQFPEIAEHTSSDLGLVRRRSCDELFQESDHDATLHFDWICENKQALDAVGVGSLRDFLQSSSRGDATCLIGLDGDRPIRVSMNEIRKSAAYFATWAEMNRIRVGETIVVARPPMGSEIAVAIIALGLIQYGVHVALADANLDNIESALAEIQPKACVSLGIEANSDASEFETFSEALSAVLSQHSVQRLELPSVTELLTGKLVDLPSDDNSASGDRSVTPEGDLVLFTSGSTGRPKIVSYSTTALLDGIRSLAVSKVTARGLDGTSVCFSFSHTIGVRNVLNAIGTGNVILMFPAEYLERYPERAISLLADHPPSHMTCGPGLLAKIKKVSRVFPLLDDAIKKLTFISSIGCDYSTAIQSQFTQDVANTYGMTEMQQVLTTVINRDEVKIRTKEDDSHARKMNRETLSTSKPLGYPFAGVAVAVRFENSKTQSGELYVKTQFGSRQTQKDGSPRWIPTGDVVTVQNDQLYFQARKSDLVGNGYGVNVSVRQLESGFSSISASRLVCLDGGVHPGIVGIVFLDQEAVSIKRIKQDLISVQAGLRYPENTSSVATLVRFAVVHSPCPINGVGKVDRPKVRREHADLVRALQNDLDHESIFQLPKNRSRTEASTTISNDGHE